MIFDPIYFLFALPGIALSLLASFMVRSAFSYYSRVPSALGITGAEAAYRLLRESGLANKVDIVEHQGYLTDHYDPQRRVLALSPEVFHGNSVASIGVAAHEAGHAIQHARNYYPLAIRSALVPTVGIGSNLGMWGMMLGLVLASQQLVIIGAVLFSGVVLFQLVTLPVEFDATGRAKRLVVEAGIISPEERRGMDRVLNAAALTYVAAALTSILTLLYFLFRAGLLGGSRDE